MELKETFDTVANVYESLRPKYPAELFMRIFSLFPEWPINVLEIGCGTGQATEYFVNQAVKLKCVDIGKNLLDVAKAKFFACDNFEFIHSSFEDFVGEPNSFDLIIAATSFHWISPEIKYKKVSLLLKPNKFLTVISQHHVNTDIGFYEEAQEIYDSVTPELSLKYRNKEQKEEITSPLVEVECTEYHWSERYSSHDYIDLLSTYSDHIALSEEKRKLLFNSLLNLIETKYSGHITKDYTTVLRIYRPE